MISPEFNNPAAPGATVLSGLPTDAHFTDDAGLSVPHSDGASTNERTDGSEFPRESRAQRDPTQPEPVESDYRSFEDFEMKADGLFKSGNRLAGPFAVIGRGRDPKGNGWGLVIRWKDRDQRVRTHLVLDADLHRSPPTLSATLADMGLEVTRGCGGHLADYLNQVEVDQRITTVRRTGWHDIRDVKCFVLPGRTIGAPAGEMVMLADVAAARYETSGTLDQWKAGVGELARSHLRAVFAVSAAFAGPLLQIVKQEGGGVHLYGRSSSGKTTLLQAAASVWGLGGPNGFVRSWRSTANGVEGAAVLHTDTALLLDEIGVLDAREAGTVVYFLATGVGKGRSNVDGGLRATKSWQTLFISTGEVRLMDKLAEEKKRPTAGQAVRLLNIPSDAGKGFGCFDHGGPNGNANEIANGMKLAAAACFGTAGPAFVAAIIDEGPDQVASVAQEMLGNFRLDNAPADADGQVLRACDRFGLIAVAGELAIDFRIVPWSKGDARSAAQATFQDWISARGGAGPHEEMAAISQVRRFIEANGTSRFQALKGDSPELRPISNCAGFRRDAGAKTEWLITPEIWKTEVCAGFDPTFVARVLAEEGMLRLDSAGRFSRSEKIDGATRRVYVLTNRILGDNDDV